MLRAPDIVLDQFVRQLDPVPWYEIRLTGDNGRVPLEELHERVTEVIDAGYVHAVGVRRSIWEDNKRHNDWLYGPTREGLRRWRTSIRGKRKSSQTFPTHTLAQRTAAVSPVDVFDLARVPWKYRLRDEQK